MENFEASLSLFLRYLRGIDSLIASGGMRHQGQGNVCKSLEMLANSKIAKITVKRT